MRRPSANTTSKEHVPGPLPLRWIPAIFTSTNRLPSLCPSTSIRRLLSPRCNVPGAKLCFRQNSLRRSPLVSNSLTSRLISWRLRRFRTPTSLISVMPTVHQKHATSARWVPLTDALEFLFSAPTNGDRSFSALRAFDLILGLQPRLRSKRASLS